MHDNSVATPGNRVEGLLAGALDAHRGGHRLHDGPAERARQDDGRAREEAPRPGREDHHPPGGALRAGPGGAPSGARGAGHGPAIPSGVCGSRCSLGPG
jgi:hypothetical protein